MSRRIISLLLLLLLAACEGESATEPTEAVPATAAPTQSAEDVAAGITVAATIAPTDTSTPLPAPPTRGESDAPATTATFTPIPDPTGFPTPLMERPAIAEQAPAPAVTLGQEPYAASDCSDKYPCNDDIAGWEARLRVPAGFTARYFARIDGLPTVMTTGPDGLLYVATISGEIYTISASGDVNLFLSGLIVPTGIAFQPGTGRLYLTSRVINEEQGEAMVAYYEAGQIIPLVTGLPCCYTSFHAANGLSFGPDGYLYVGIGARADHGEILDTDIQDELSPIEATILRIAPDGSEMAPYAYGFRNSYDHAWDSEGRLFSGDNGPDAQPGWDVNDEFHLIQPGAQHGYPWYDCESCFKAPDDITVLPPTYGFVPHSSPTGVSVYLGSEWAGYYDSIFVSLWSAFEGAQKVMRFAPGGTAPGDFLTGLSSPIDITFGADGQMYVIDYFTGIIVRISYES